MPRVLGDQELTLRDGRRIGDTLYGDACGSPVLNGAKCSSSWPVTSDDGGDLVQS